MVYVAGAGTGVDNDWEQKKHEATLREMLKIGAESQSRSVPRAPKESSNERKVR
jgi:hypothetical protein